MLDTPAIAPDGTAGAEKHPLGTTRQDCVPASNNALNRRYKLQSLAAKLLPERRVAECHRKIAPGRGAAKIMHSSNEGRAWYGSLVQCNRVWECPVCAARITAGRRDELSAALAVARKKEMTPVLISVTLRHHAGDDLNSLLAGLLEAWRAFKSGREYQELKEEYSWAGDVRNLEVTYGENGWHPHCHVLAFMDRKLSKPHVEGLRRWVKERWSEVVERQGLNASYEHGVDVTEADDDIADYVAKFGKEPKGHWGAADELGRSAVKRARGESCTPFELLAGYGRDQDDEFWTGAGLFVGTPARAGALFREYAVAFERRNQLVWSRGLRALLAMPEEPIADDQIDESAPDAKELVTLHAPAWFRVVKLEKRAELLAVAAAGDAAAVWKWLEGLGIYCVDLREYSMGQSPPASLTGGNNSVVHRIEPKTYQNPLF